MKWIQVDTNAPYDPRIRIIKKHCGLAGFGALVNLWLFVGEHGKARPGWSLDSSGNPIPLEYLIAASETTEQVFQDLISVAAKTGHVDPLEWRRRRVIVFHAMAKRADTYTQRRARVRTLAEPTPNTSRTLAEQGSASVPVQTNKQTNSTSTNTNTKRSARSADRAARSAAPGAGAKKPTTKNGHAAGYAAVLRLARQLIRLTPTASAAGFAGEADFVALKENLKTACARKGIPYDAEIIGKAAESAIAIGSKQKRRRA